MKSISNGQIIEWDRLFREFESFETSEEDCKLDCRAFAESLLQPIPKFAEAFIRIKSKQGPTRDEAVRDLYCFLLEKRHAERLNLLHFAFNVFDDGSRLPKEIIDRTPFPHEDGVPTYGLLNKAEFPVAPDPPDGSKSKEQA